MRQVGHFFLLKLQTMNNLFILLMLSVTFWSGQDDLRLIVHIFLLFLSFWWCTKSRPMELTDSGLHQQKLHSLVLNPAADYFAPQLKVSSRSCLWIVICDFSSFRVWLYDGKPGEWLWPLTCVGIEWSFLNRVWINYVLWEAWHLHVNSRPLLN